MPKKLALLVDGPNIDLYRVRSGVPLSEILRTILQCAEWFGEAHIRTVYFTASARSRPKTIEAAFNSGYSVVIGRSSREIGDIDELIKRDARAYLKGEIDALALSSGDSDFIPIAQETRETGKDFILIHPYYGCSQKLIRESAQAVRLPFPATAEISAPGAQRGWKYSAL